jgi:hypothetical protein
MICKYWKDYCEPDIGLAEWCKAENKSCNCSGEEKQCNYPEWYTEDKENYCV